MKTAAMALGITGGVLTFIVAFFGITFAGGVYFGGNTFYVSDITLWGLLVLSLGVIIAGVCGIVGGAIARQNRMAAAILLMIAGVASFASLNWFGVFPGVMFFVGAGLAMGAKDARGLIAQQQ